MLTALQTIFGVVLNALVLGLIVIRIIRRSPKIMFASNVVYNRISHELNFWFWNRDADDFCNTKVDVILKRNLPYQKHPFVRYTNFPLFLSKKAPPYVVSMTTVVTRTNSEGISPDSPPELGMTPNKVSALSFREDDEFLIILSGFSVDSGSSIVARKSYTLGDIKCGTFRHILSGDKDTGNWRDRNYSNFNVLDPTPINECKKCKIIKDCPLDVASTSRNSSENDA